MKPPSKTQRSTRQREKSAPLCLNAIRGEVIATIRSAEKRDNGDPVLRDLCYIRLVRDLYQAATLHEAQLLVDRLEEHGIRTYVRNADLQGALGELPLTLRPIVTILAEQDWELAARILLEFEAACHAPPSPEQVCPHCGECSPGNFELCWKCRQPFTHGALN